MKSACCIQHAASGEACTFEVWSKISTDMFVSISLLLLTLQNSSPYLCQIPLRLHIISLKNERGA